MKKVLAVLVVVAVVWFVYEKAFRPAGGGPPASEEEAGGTDMECVDGEEGGPAGGEGEAEEETGLFARLGAWFGGDEGSGASKKKKAEPHLKATVPKGYDELVDVPLIDESDNPVRLKDLVRANENKVVLLRFEASSADKRYCANYGPKVKAFQREFEDFQGMNSYAVAAIGIDMSAKDAKAMAAHKKKYGLTFPFYRYDNKPLVYPDPDIQNILNFSNMFYGPGGENKVPATLFIKYNRVHKRIYDQVPGAALDAALKEVLAATRQ